ncbi:MAG: hypothetical protein K2W95_35380 [Candidatus Obscuribacterales bacterium]|nr:hypothetical protein [Candidatus Obscuribacterales bacterium]
MFERVSAELVGYASTREDLATIFSYQWQSSRHKREAIKLLLASYLDEAIDDEEYLRSTLPAEDLLFLQERSEAQLRLASNPACNAILLDYICRLSPSAEVLERVALNPNCAEVTLRKLSVHESPDVRAAVSEHPACSKDVMEELAKDSHSDVRFRMAENVHCDRDILEKLCQDENPFVVARAQESLKRLNSVVIVGRFPTAEIKLRLVNGD